MIAWRKESLRLEKSTRFSVSAFTITHGAKAVKRGNAKFPNVQQEAGNDKKKAPEAIASGAFVGTPSGARTLDTLIKSQVLDQLS